MPINTYLPGQPGSVYAAAQWLRVAYAQEVAGASTTLRAVGGEAAELWHGAAGRAFAARMSTAAVKADDLHARITATADVLDRYADGLASALASMAHARAIALQAGLIVSGPAILEPIPAGLSDATYHRRVIAFRYADIEVRRGRVVMMQSNQLVRGWLAEFRSRPAIQPADVSPSGTEPAGGAYAYVPPGQGVFLPRAEEHLLGHELTHVVQQRSGVQL